MARIKYYDKHKQEWTTIGGGSGGSDIPEVYIGPNNPPPDGTKIQINPSGEYVEIFDAVGQSTTDLMSQKAITDELNKLSERIQVLENKLNKPV